MGNNLIIALGALIILSIFMSSSNRLMTEQAEIADQNEYYLTALSIGQSVLEEAKNRAFDEKTVHRSYALPHPDSLTAPNLLGRDWLENVWVPLEDTLTISAPFSSSAPGFRSSIYFNDVDDYKGYRRLVHTPRAEGYRVGVTVSYASPTNPDSVLNCRTWCKTITVRVTSPFFRKLAREGQAVQDTITLKYAMVY